MRATGTLGTWRDWKGDLVSSASQLQTVNNQCGIPPELSSEAALLAYLSMTPGELKNIWWFRGRMYQHFNIAKRGGKLRLISAPDARLKFLQQRIAALLDKLYRRRNPVHGYVVDRSIKSNAKAHLKGRFVLNVDILNYFPSITENRVSGLLAVIGIDTRVAQIVARICCNNHCLPQGAPSSPVISNMICFRLDRNLLAYAKEVRCIYTRYADDISFSSYQPLALLFGNALPPAGKVELDALSITFRSIFEQNGFKLNPEKVHYADRNSRRTVTGLKINENLNVDRKFVRNVRATLFDVERNGLPAAQLAFEDDFGGTASIESHLRGKISWLGSIKGYADPVYRSLAKRFNASFPGKAIRVAPTLEEQRDRAVWVIEDEEGVVSQGSAFFLRDVGLITAAHCVEKVIKPIIYHPAKPSNRWAVSVAKSCDHRDIALLDHQIPDTDFFELATTKQKMKIGDDVQSVGYPGFGPGQIINVRSGKVTSLPVKSAVQLIEVDQKHAQGMSGGPVLDSDYGVVGIVHKGGPTEERYFAIHVDELLTWIKTK